MCSIPRSYVILQRINLGLFALLGELSATADWRAIAEEIWPFVQAPPSTPMGEAEAAWRARRRWPRRRGPEPADCERCLRPVLARHGVAGACSRMLVENDC